MVYFPATFTMHIAFVLNYLLDNVKSMWTLNSFQLWILKFAFDNCWGGSLSGAMVNMHIQEQESDDYKYEIF